MLPICIKGMDTEEVIEQGIIAVRPEKCIGEPMLISDKAQGPCAIPRNYVFYKCNCRENEQKKNCKKSYHDFGFLCIHLRKHIKSMCGFCAPSPVPSVYSLYELQGHLKEFHSPYRGSNREENELLMKNHSTLLTFNRLKNELIRRGWYVQCTADLRTFIDQEIENEYKCGAPFLEPVDTCPTPWLENNERNCSLFF